MKKLILFLGLALALSGLSYGMDFNFDPIIVRDAVAQCDWSTLCNGLLSSGQKQAFVDMVLEKDIKNLNNPGRDGEYLFEKILCQYATSIRSDHLDLWKNLLEALILKGLDCTVQRNGCYVYKLCNEYECAFTRLFEGMLQQYPAEKERLLRQCGMQIVAPAIVQSEVRLIDGTTSGAAQKIRDEKLTKGITYLCIGCVALVVVSCGYKLYMKYVADNEQEKDEEKNQKTQQEPAEYVMA